MEHTMRWEQLEDTMRHFVSELGTSAPNLLTQQQRRELIGNLPRLQEAEVISLGQQDSLCPICFTPVLALLAEEETALAMDSPAHPLEELGVTRLSQTWQCGHVFCRRDISKWIRDGHGSCPTCRRLLTPPIDSSGETTSEPAVPATATIDLDSEDARVLLEELQDQMAFLVAHGSELFPNNTESRRNYDNDQNNHVGMYS